MEITIIPLQMAKTRPQYIPLSFSQERLWFIERFEEGEQFPIPIVLRLKGKLNKNALINAIQNIVNRHEILRTVILENDGEAYQQILPKEPFQISIIDATTDKGHPADLQKWIQELTEEPFDLSRDHLLRVSLISFDEETQILLIVFHPIAFDSRSKSILIKELDEYYRSCVRGRQAVLPELPLQYGDYTTWQRNFFRGAVLNQQLEYWKDKLLELTPLALPTDRSRPKVLGNRGASAKFSVDELLLKQLQSISLEKGVSLFITLLSAFKVLLYRYSGQHDICVGTTVEGRQRQEFKNLLGYFVNTLVLRSGLNGDATFTDLLQVVNETVMRAYEHQDLPFEKVVDSIVRERDLSRNPLFQVMFEFQEEAREVTDLEMEGLHLSVEPYEFSTGFYDIAININDTGRELQCTLNYNTDLFDEGTIVGMAGHFKKLLHSIVNEPGQSIAVLPMLSADEEHRLLVQFNDTAIASPKNKTIVDLFEEQASRTPDAVAVVSEKAQLTYKELNERSNQLAHYLQHKGVKPESMIPLCIERSPEMIVGIMGILKAGGAYVPIDPEYPEERISFMIQETEATLLVGSRYSKSRLQNVGELNVIELDTDWSIINKHPSLNLEKSTESHHLAYVIYTSGSTGKPKGVMVEHGNAFAFICWCRKEFSSSLFEIVYAGTSVCFDLSIFEIFFSLSIGKRIRVIENGLYIGKYLSVDRNVLINCVPAIVHNLLVEGTNLENVNVINMAGEPIPIQVQQALDASRMEIRNLYGPTEDTTYSTVFRLKNNERVLIGKPIANTQIYIVDKAMKLVPIGIAGEICIGGAGLARGYLKRDTLTAEKFIANPFSKEPGARLYKTGDLGKWLPDGNIVYLGRLDEQVKIRGYRIELGEIETVLLQSEMVNQAVVLAKQENEGSKRLVGYIVPDWKSVKTKERELYLQQVANWKELYETEYEKAENENVNPEFNIVGWNNSFTGLPIAEEQMHEWLKDIVALIFMEDPGIVLEIGCGTGLIYYQLAGKVKKYIGTDFSSSSIKQIQNRISKGIRNYGPTELIIGAAHELLFNDNDKADTVIINSVVQYFPGEDYLTEVIQKSIAVIKGRGRIIIGDVRDNRLLKLFKSRLMLEKLQHSLSVKEFKWAVDQEVLKEEELCFSPNYFYGLSTIFPQITHVEIQWKNSSFINELTQYRFNVVIYVGIEKELLKPQWQAWKNTTAELITDQLKQGVQTIALTGVPNHRLFGERMLNESLAQSSAITVADLVQAVNTEDQSGKAVQQVLNAALSCNYYCRFLLHEDPLKLNLLIEINPSEKFIQPFPVGKGNETDVLNTNTPLFFEIGNFLQKDIRSMLQQQLPDYMVPSEILLLAQLPLTGNGKVDRGFLSQREEKSQVNKLNYEAPRNSTELALADSWQDLLGIERIGIHDDFFDLGGHSLLATRVVSAVRKKLNVELIIKDLFDYPTIAELAGHLGAKSKGLLLPSIGVQERPTYIPLSFSQMRLWFIDRLEGSVHYHMPAVLRLKGNLNKDALAYALKHIVNRHEVLRTVILEKDGIPYQRIMPVDGLHLTVIDDGAHYKNNFKKLQNKIQQLINETFDLSKDHMLRAALIILNDQESILVVTMHHIASDGWSMPVIVKEMKELYSASNERRPVKLKPLEIQFADYAIWQNKYVAEEFLIDKIGYWKEQLQGVESLQLPIDFPRPAVLSREGGCANFRINKKLSSALKLLSQQEGTTLFMTLLAAFQVLLYKYSGQQDICVGTPIAGRLQEELEGLIGFFVNTLVLRNRMDGKTSFRDLLHQVKSTTLEAYAHQEVPYEKVVETLVKERDRGKSPLFQVMLVLQNTPDIQGLQLEGLQVTNGVAGAVPLNTSKFELTFIITETARGLKCTVEYSTDLYKVETIKRMMSHFIELLNSAVTAPNQSIGLLPILTRSESKQLLVDFNNTASEYPLSKTIVDIFEEQANKHPLHIALLFEGEQLTYRQVNEQSNQMARYLQNKGVEPGMMVAVCVERSIEMLIGIMGILKSGAAYVPIDSNYPLDLISYMLYDISATMVLSNKGNKKKLPVNNTIEIIEIDSEWPLISQQSKEQLSVMIKPTDLAYVIYTSGSTGKPKGVMVTQENVVSLVKGIDYVTLNNRSILLSTGSSSFDATTFEYWGMLLNGGCLVLCAEKRLLDNRLLKEEITRRNVNIMWFTSGWFNQLVEADITLFEKLETILVGGEKLSEYHIGKLMQAFPGIEIINGYGPTENTTFSLTYNITQSGIHQSIPIGRPLNNRGALILDENNQLVPIGVSGEIYLSGAGLSRGYLNRPELTMERFVKDPFSEDPSARLYRTGDIGRWLPDGNIEFFGRKDGQVKLRGYRIELGQIESILQECELVSKAVVLAKQDKEGNNRLVAYIVPKEIFHKESLQTFLKARLPDYMVPTFLVELKDLPLTPNGKIDRNALPNPDLTKLISHQFVAPRNELEEKLAIIWKEVLLLERVSVHDNFFEIGGHSLNAIRVVSVIRKRMGIDIFVNDIFIYPTIAGLVGNINEKIKDPLSPAVNIKYLVPIKTGGNKVPLYIVAGGGGTALRFRKFGELLGPDQPVYVLQPPTETKDLKKFPTHIEGIAEKFIEEILFQNPEGPYSLSGHCLGGIIAFEMARQLKERGKHVHLLAMFDTIIDETVEQAPGSFKNLYNIPAFVRSSISKLVLKVKFEVFLLRKHTRQSIQYKVDKLISLRNRFKRRNLNPDEVEFGEMEVFDETAELYEAASKNYKLSSYKGHIVLFYAKEHYFFLDKGKNVEYKRLYLDEMTKNRWKQYATTVSIYEVEGEHSEIFDPVHANEFALFLQQYLEKSDS